jgi:predicted amidohydrolase
MRALLAQLEPAGTPDENAGRAAEIIRSRGAVVDLIAFPELYLTGYDLGRVASVAIALDSAPLAAIREAAADAATAVAVGLAERRGRAIANTAVLIDERGAILAPYRKTHLFGAEEGAFERGDELIVAELGGARIGTMICFDMEFPETARELARAGAELLLTVSANMESFYGDHLIASQARALDNRLPHLYVNRCGSEAGLRFIGGSRAVRPDGTVAAEAERDRESLLEADVDRPGADDDRVDYLAQLRDDLRITDLTTTGGPR